MLWRAPWLRYRLALITFAAWDATSVYVSYNVTSLMRLGRWEGWSLGMAVAATTWLSISYLSGRYSPRANRAKQTRYKAIAETILAGIVVIGIFVGHSWVYQVVDAQTRFRGFLIPFVVCTCLLSTLGEVLRRLWTEKRRDWILIGSQEETQTIEKELKSETKVLRTRTSVGNIDEFKSLITLPSNSPKGIAVGNITTETNKETERLLRLREKGECIVPLLSWCEQELQRIPPELIHAEWLIQAEGFGLRPGSISWRVKRCGDVVGALLLICLTAPMLIIGGVCVWLEDKGPIFYQQVRSGLYGKPIRIWKLRSMKVDAERAGAQWASKSDPRITNVGKVIRATRIDELPQLFSVLSGDLSLIGPRPERPEFEEVLEKEIANYRVRHWIRPGLSGWAQVCYPYGASKEDSRMKLSYDLYYLRNANFLLDILITIKTIRLVAGAKGAKPN